MPSGTVACVGAGVIGASWAVTYARGGYEVALYDSSDEAAAHAMVFIDRTLGDLLAGGWIQSAEAVLRRIRVARSLSDAVKDACYVQESVKEDVALKRAVFADLDQAVRREAILASSTSEFPASHFVSSLPGRSRCLVAHPLNPPHLVPLVELCPTQWTDPGVVTDAHALLTSVGQEPIVLKRELAGFVANRLQVAVIIEALRLAAEGYCSAPDIDRAMKRGLGLRWALMGPFETNHLAAPGGYADFLREYGPTLSSIGNSLNMHYVASAEAGRAIQAALEQELAHASVQERASWRDRSLIKLRMLLESLTQSSSRAAAAGAAQT